MAKKEKDTIVKKTFKYREKDGEYTLKLKRRNWWWLLLLLPLLLFIRCNKDITVTCVDADSGFPVIEQEVELSCTAHYLFYSWRFFDKEQMSLSEKTDENGKAVFRDVPCSVFCYLFHLSTEMVVSAKNDCYAPAEARHKFHFTSNVELQMKPLREDLHVKLLDLETKDPLPDGKLVYKYVERGEEITDSAFADPAGIVTLPKMRYCSVMKLLHGQCYGYADTIKQNIPCQQLLVARDSTALLLRPLKERFTFFVRNDDTKEPIPGAECLVTLTHPSGKMFGPFKTTTSVDGKGMAFYDNAFVRAQIDIKASKPPYYRDSVLIGGPWIVEDFTKQDEEIRTIWLKPLSFTQEFVNVDSISGDAIPEVKNEILVTNPDGSNQSFTEISNRNGVFPVSATENSKIKIVSVKDPCYRSKRTVYQKFKDADNEILMSPIMETLSFRMVDAKQPTALVPNCELDITGSQSGHLKPTDSGRGEFNVTFRRCETLSITASKKDYATNSTTVQRRDWDYLSADKKRRDIPMRPEFIYQYSGNNRSYTECYDLKSAPASFTFSWETCLVCTMIIVKDENGNELGRFGVNNPSGQGFVTPYSPGTGDCVLKSPTRQICVYVTDVNGCHCQYTIKSM